MIKKKNDSSRLIGDAAKYGADHYNPLPIVLSKGEGCWVTDVDGKRYLDLMSAYSALNHGHRHPKIVKAMKEQLDTLTLTSRAFHSAPHAPLLKELSAFCGMDKSLLMNTGAEAVETAIKLTRKWGYQVKGVPRHEAEIIVCSNNFHGRTTTIISFSTDETSRRDFGPFTPGFKIIPHGDIKALEDAITPNTVGFLVEPIQGESGIRVPPEGYLKEVREVCDRHNLLLIADEIQVGLGRTGKKFCFQHDQIEPDILILGKALGGGVYPVSAVVTKEHLLGLFEKGEHGSTFGGNPLGAAVARASLRVLDEENLVQKAAEMGQRLMEGLRKISSPHITEIRGKGLMVGIELKEGLSAREFCLRLLDKGLLCKDTHSTVIRIAPPLIIKENEIDFALDVLQEILGSEVS